MRKLMMASLMATVLLLALAFAMSGSISAQGPDSPPAKGTDPLPTTSTAATPSRLQIDRALLSKIEPQLLKKLIEANGAARPFIIYLKAQTDLAAAVASAQLTAQGEPDLITRRTAIVDALQQTARSSQAGVLQALRSPPPPTGGLSTQSTAAIDIRPLWIVNAVAATGNLQMVLTLAARSDVEVIRLDKEISLSFPERLNPDSSMIDSGALIPHQQSTEWGIAKIRADLVHNALEIDGSGVVVANIDTGVDWQHTSLQTKYRGYAGAGKLPQHVGNWYDSTGNGATYPVDGNGHGTHTMGTMVGDGGIGVAPGAQWVAVRAFDSSGNGQFSWLHDAFQWLLAPNGDPALAPSIVNNSWGNDFGASTEFEADVQALLNAGIYPVFSAGNNGPGSGTVGSPGSLDISFAVGATTIDDEIANFSSRGPSPWGKIKPEVSAPGTDVVSTLPGGAFGSLNGTSMAAPHVSGLAALLLEASPNLSKNLNDISRVITSTATPLGSEIPNNTFGWGRVDAYNAVMSVASAGTLRGTVTQAGSGTPISNATIRLTPHGGGPAVTTTSDPDGFYQQGLASNSYDATVSAFGYQAASVFNITILDNSTTTQNFSLSLQPTGTLAGTVKDKDTNAPLAATISIDGTPAETTTNPVDGSYTLNLPVGVYTATAIATEHRIAKSVNITINDGATVTRNFLLDDAPTILLVDSGQWYQESQIEFYQQALDDLLYPHDTWQIKQPFETPNDVPGADTLLNYDIVIWSSPNDSPGYVDAGMAIEEFLEAGGKLLLSGQDVAFFDGGGSIFGTESYLAGYLKASFAQDDSGSVVVDGVSGTPFDNLSLNISGGDGANNQISPDVIANNDEDFARSSLTYDNDQLAGLHIGLCVPYRAMFLPFGFEAINARTDRSAVMDRALNWLLQTSAPTGVELTPMEETRIGDFGSVVSHTVRLRNTGTGNDTFSLTLSNGAPHNWPVVSAPPASISLASCQTQVLTTEVRVDTTNSWHISDTLTLTAQSGNDPAVTATVTRTTKSPAPVLLVDDDRFFSFAAEFKEALSANDMAYDYWLVPKSWSGPVPPSPPLATLQMYPMVVWYTAYDWFNPLIEVEEDRLAAYLDGGGRLFFSSQDYIYNLPEGEPGPFAQDYLGVLDHTEDFSSTAVIGELDNPLGTQIGPYALTFPPGYNNWTDALTPTTTARVATRGQADQPNGLTHNGLGSGSEAWRTAFFSYGPELLSADDRARLMQRSLGWLSWLGSSKVTPSASATVDGSVISYTAVITNDGWHDLATAHFTATFPSELTVESFSSELSPSGDDLVWSGPLAKDQRKVFTYTASVADLLPLGTVIDQTSWLAYPEHNVTFDRVATIKVNFPDLGTSAMHVTPAQGVEAGDELNYTIVLKNSGLADAPAVTTTNTLPHMLELVAVDTPTQGSANSDGDSLTWTTPLARNEVATLTYRAVISYQSSGAINNVADVDDNFNDPVALTARTTFKILPTYLPLIFKN